MTRIDAKYLTKVYKNGAYGLKNCSLSVKGGDFLVVVGASGAGKSTLLKVLAGTEQLSSGELYFDGILADNIPTAKRSVSMVFQEYVLYPHMTVFDNLAAPLKLSGENEKSIYDRVMGALRLFNLDIAADVKPKNLSGGEQQRVALAKALLKRSKLVLLDEPMSNVDEKSRWEYCRTLKKMKQMLPESTFIYVTHNTREALFLADRIAVMQDGMILQSAQKNFLLRHFEHLSAMEILGVIDNISKAEFNGESFTLDKGLSTAKPQNIDYSKIAKGQSVIAVKSIMDDEILHIFDEAGRSLSISSAELRLCGSLEKNTLEFANQSIKLNDEYINRLLHRPRHVSVVLTTEKFSKTVLSNCFSLIFEVTKNGGDYVVLKIQEKSFILNKKTELKTGERIRLYYKIEDLLLYDGDERLTCHYPLRKKIKIKVLDAKNGRIEILGKRIRLKGSIPRSVGYARITDQGFELSYNRGTCAVRVYDCLDEEFINGKKLSQIALRGVEGYLSFMSKEEITCFGKNKVWLNVIPDGLEIENGEY